jgi:hypothetical protein
MSQRLTEMETSCIIKCLFNIMADEYINNKREPLDTLKLIDYTLKEQIRKETIQTIKES